ncbi:hypothetical protein ACTL6U_09340 [Rhodovibrionaceae bacterium A322]
MATQTEKIVPPYDALGAQLCDLPTQKGKTASTAEERMALSNHGVWVEAIFQEAYRPSLSPADLYRLFPQEEGNFDLVRGSMTGDGIQFQTASSQFVLAVTVDLADLSLGQGDATALAQAAARSLFALPSPSLVFQALGQEGAVQYGIRDFKAEGRPTAPDWPFWADLLAWFCDGTLLSFVTTKAPGGPTQQSISPAADQNRLWFSAR